MKRKGGLDVFRSNGYDDSMPCIVTTSTTSADIHFSGQDIHQLSFSLISPLRTKHDRRCISLSQRAAKRVGYEMGSLPFMMMGGWSLNEPFLRKMIKDAASSDFATLDSLSHARLSLKSSAYLPDPCNPTQIPGAVRNTLPDLNGRSFVRTRVVHAGSV